MSSLKTEVLLRELQYNGVRIPDPGPELTVDQVRDLLTPAYPEIATASVTGPEDTGSALAGFSVRAFPFGGSAASGSLSPVLTFFILRTVVKLQGGPMPKGPFRSDQFVPTEWSTAEEKAKFGNALLHFVQSEWRRTLFRKKFYQRLSVTFGHIAHYNIDGSYSTWFERDVDRLEFLRRTIRYPCYGDPRFTFCDVEQAIRNELRKLNLIPLYEQRIALATRKRELDELARLQKKYGGSPAPGDELHRSEASLAVESKRQNHTVIAPSAEMPVQRTLF